MKRLFFIFPVLVVMLLASSILSNFLYSNTPDRISEDDVLISCFSSSGAVVHESSISCAFKISDSFLSKEKLLMEMQKIIDMLEPLDFELSEDFFEGEDRRMTSGKVLLRDSIYTINLEAVAYEDGGETYAMIEGKMDKNLEQLKEGQGKLSKMLETYKSDSNIYSCIVGTYEGKLSESEIESSIEACLKAINARKIEGVPNHELYSISAYSRNIREFVNSGSKNINVQIASRYSSYDDKTYIWVGTPVIVKEY